MNHQQMYKPDRYLLSVVHHYAAVAALAAAAAADPAAAAAPRTAGTHTPSALRTAQTDPTVAAAVPAAVAADHSSLAAAGSTAAAAAAAAGSPRSPGTAERGQTAPSVAGCTGWCPGGRTVAGTVCCPPRCWQQ